MLSEGVCDVEHDLSVAVIESGDAQGATKLLQDSALGLTTAAANADAAAAPAAAAAATAEQRGHAAVGASDKVTEAQHAAAAGMGDAGACHAGDLQLHGLLQRHVTAATRVGAALFKDYLLASLKA
jgi:hypothetical protein